MNLSHLSNADKAAVGQALRAAAEGLFFPEWEFHTLFGMARSEVRAVADAWPNVDLTDSITARHSHSGSLNAPSRSRK
jgi:hypothetical protein